MTPNKIIVVGYGSRSGKTSAYIAVMKSLGLARLFGSEGIEVTNSVRKEIDDFHLKLESSFFSAEEAARRLSEAFKGAGYSIDELRKSFEKTNQTTLFLKPHNSHIPPKLRHNSKYSWR